MLEVVAVLGLAATGALWRMAFEQGSMKKGMESILNEVRLLRNEVSKDIRHIERNLHDHEKRIRNLEDISHDHKKK